MNDRLSLIGNIARWEFNRFFKLSDIIYGTFLILIKGLLRGAVTTFLGRNAVSIPEIAVIHAGPLAMTETRSRWPPSFAKSSSASPTRSLPEQPLASS